MATDDTHPRSDDDTRTLSADLGLEGGTTREDGPEGPESEAAGRAVPPPATTAGPTPTGVPQPYGPPVVYRTGPAPFALFLGLLGLLVAVVVLVGQSADVSPAWDEIGPWAVVAGGVVVAGVGVLGLRAGRRAD
ncbi:hypothetical protein [Phycicoccus flavus]|uniref:hypothetical protein n=1 Tax=Phycicoccus flavus TaxID=2502783 RepID=UPI000FEB763A|nr:hypothetical protein [Phycicoccus flavus]NHA68509.1 hypothetical protein [Phycicoccus flavus]